ncbi:hypothetical protein A3860_26775 [Niastella vici]|uniref:Uncharacterized protein n=1 Tax=Niastella vici TaxID=1703345 RepID=A0A1V9FWE3_9BACT|nr:hypothetical protein [Niastella vici]OQP62618.1 hypothetical protein A3860_26775 [Niastella vici]
MNTVQDFKKQLSDVEAKISELQISPSTYETIALLNKRLFLGKKIAQIEWNELSDTEKGKKRDQDLFSTEKFFQKYPEDVKNKYLYKKQYILLVQKVKILINISSLYQPLFRTLLIVLDSNDYINIHDNICIKALFEQIKSDEEAAKELVNAYMMLLQIPYEI